MLKIGAKVRVLHPAYYDAEAGTGAEGVVTSTNCGGRRGPIQVRITKISPAYVHGSPGCQYDYQETDLEIIEGAGTMLEVGAKVRVKESCGYYSDSGAVDAEGIVTNLSDSRHLTRPITVRMTRYGSKAASPLAKRMDGTEFHYVAEDLEVIAEAVPARITEALPQELNVTQAEALAKAAKYDVEWIDNRISGSATLQPILERIKRERQADYERLSAALGGVRITL